MRAETTLSAGSLERDRTGTGQHLGDGVFTPLESSLGDEAVVRFAGVRSEWGADLSAGVFLKWGLELRSYDAEYDYQSRAVRRMLDDEGRVTTRTDEGHVSASPAGSALGGWLGLRHRLGPVTWEGGLRYDAHGWTDERNLSPRLLASWSPDPLTAVRASVGRYTQAQGIHELQVPDGETTFTTAERATLFALGVERRTRSGWTLRLDGYARSVEEPRPEWVNLSREVNPMQELEADRTRLEGSRARAHGIELLLTDTPVGAWDWSASYALARTELEVDGRWTPRTLDQRHTLNLFGAWTVSGRWQLSASWQYHSGWPFTDQYLEVALVPREQGEPSLRIVRREFGPLNAERLPPYHRLDLRVTRTFAVRGGSLDFFLDVFNAYDRQNLRGYQYYLRPTASGLSTVRDSGEELLPILPTLGVRWTF